MSEHYYAVIMELIYEDEGEGFPRTNRIESIIQNALQQPLAREGFELDNIEVAKGTLESEFGVK